MTRESVLAMMSVLKAAYPAYYAKMSKESADNVVSLWSEMFADDDENVVRYSLKQLIATHSGFPPDIAAVKSKMAEVISAATNEMTDGELWNALSDAVVNNSAYAHECNRAFQALPKIVQRWVGTPARLHELGMGDQNVFQTVTRGQFLKSIPAMRERVKFSESMPSQIKAYVTGLLKEMPQDQLTDENDRRNDLLNALDGITGRGV